MTPSKNIKKLPLKASGFILILSSLAILPGLSGCASAPPYTLGDLEGGREKAHNHIEDFCSKHHWYVAESTEDKVTCSAPADPENVGWGTNWVIKQVVTWKISMVGADGVVTYKNQVAAHAKDNDNNDNNDDAASEKYRDTPVHAKLGHRPDLLREYKPSKPGINVLVVGYYEGHNRQGSIRCEDMPSSRASDFADFLD